MKIKSLDILCNQKKLFVVLNETYFDFLKKRIEEKCGSVNKFNLNFFKLNYQIFNWPFQKKKGINLQLVLRIMSLLNIDRVNLKRTF